MRGGAEYPLVTAAAASRCGPPKLQIMLVASPRNQPSSRDFWRNADFSRPSQWRLADTRRLLRLICTNDADWSCQTAACRKTVPEPQVLTCLGLAPRAKADAPSC